MRAMQTLTTTEAARLAVVAPSTIKRWADRNMLPFSRTAGGHRRFERREVESFLRQPAAGAMTHEDPRVDRWLRCLIDARRHEVESRLLEARSRLGAWCDVADEVALALVEMGRQWELGKVSIADEHVATDCLSRSLARIGDALPTREAGSRCLLACAADDEHTLGLSLAELCLRERGWTPLWLGRHTPLSEVRRLAGDHAVEMVALTASGARHGAKTLASIAAGAAEACRANGVDLVLGGAGPWPIQPSHGHRMTSFVAFGDYLTEAASNHGRVEPRAKTRA